MVSDLAFENGKESQQARIVNGVAWKRKTPLGGLITTGEFGAILQRRLGPGRRDGALGNHGWETHGRIHYSIDRAIRTTLSLVLHRVG